MIHFTLMASCILNCLDLFLRGHKRLAHYESHCEVYPTFRTLIITMKSYKPFDQFEVKKKSI
jgi:hypothetical protein